MNKSIARACALVAVVAMMSIVGCKGGGGGSAAQAPAGTVQGIETPSSISVVSANNG